MSNKSNMFFVELLCFLNVVLIYFLKVHAQISGCMSKANELEDIDRIKLELESWVEKKENEVAKLLQRPAKLRPGNVAIFIWE